MKSTCKARTKTDQNIPLISKVDLRSLSVSKRSVPLNDTWNEIGKEWKHTWLKVLLITEIDYLHLSFSRKIVTSEFCLTNGKLRVLSISLSSLILL